MKKIIAVLTAFAMVFAFAACNKNDNKPEETKPTETVSQQETVSDKTEVPVTDANGENVTPSENQSEVASEPVSLPDDPSQWTTEQIVEFYKAAATKTHPNVKSSQVMSMNEMIINNGDGALGFLINMVEPLFIAALKRNSVEVDGITGGYSNLTASDLQSAKAYKSGNYTIIEMRPKEQTDGAYGDTFGGTVGHAISVVGGIDVVLKEFPKLNVNLDEAYIAIHYTKPVVKVRINNNGIIEKGTWSYTVDVDVDNLEIEKVKIKTADAKIDYIITLGGGF